MSHRVAAVRAAGVRVPLTPHVIAEATRASAPGEDHPGRVRVATTLGLPAPPKPPLPQGDSRRSADLPAARAAARVLAAVGPLHLPVLLAVVTRSRRFRGRTPLTATNLVAALTTVGATKGPDGTWRAPPGVPVPDRYRAIVETGAGRDLTRAEMIGVLIVAGYSPGTARPRRTGG